MHCKNQENADKQLRQQSDSFLFEIHIKNKVFGPLEEAVVCRQLVRNPYESSKKNN